MAQKRYPRWTVHKGGDYIAAFMRPQDAAEFVARIAGEGHVVAFRHKTVVWTEGEEVFSAAQNPAAAAGCMQTRALDA